jgi:hypothetical protein
MLHERGVKASRLCRGVEAPRRRGIVEVSRREDIVEVLGRQQGGRPTLGSESLSGSQAREPDRALLGPAGLPVRCQRGRHLCVKALTQIGLQSEQRSRKQRKHDTRMFARVLVHVMCVLVVCKESRVSCVNVRAMCVLVCASVCKRDCVRTCVCVQPCKCVWVWCALVRCITALMQMN